MIAVVINDTRPAPDQMNLDDLQEVIEAQRDQLRPLLQQLARASKVVVQTLGTLSVRVGEVLGEALSRMGTKRSL